MGILQRLSALALCQAAGAAGAAVGMSAEASAGSAAAFINDRFRDSSEGLTHALQRAADRAWQALEIALAGDSFWDRCKGFLTTTGDQRGFGRELRAFVEALPLSELGGDGETVRQRCLLELRAARKAGVLLGGNLEPQELARSAGAFARFSDAQGLLDAEWRVVGGLAEEVRQAGHLTLARLLELRPRQGPPLLVVAVQYFFHREVESDDVLFRRMSLQKLDRMGQAQQEGFAALADALTRHGSQIEQTLAGLADLVAQTHGAVLGMQSEQQRQGHRMDDIYEAVQELRRRPGSEAAAPVREKRAFGGPPSQRFETTRLGLRVPMTGGAVRNLCLLAQREARLGKNRENDIVLRLMPPSADNEAAWGRISRTHAVVRLNPDGVVWQNSNCQNGTLVGARLLVAGASRPLLPGTILRPANVLELKAHVAPPPPTLTDEAYRRFEQSLGVQPLTTDAVPSVRLVRIDNLAGLEEYVLFARAVLLGSDPSCPLHLPHASVSPVHAQVLWLGQSFWLEPLQVGRPTTAAGQVVPLEHLVPLRPGMALRAGEIEMTVGPYQQLYLETVAGA